MIHHDYNLWLRSDGAFNSPLTVIRDDGTEMDELPIKELTEWNWGRVWLCCVVDCFSPPLFLVVADDESTAIELFLDSDYFARCHSVEDFEMDDYPANEEGWRDGLHWTPNTCVPFDAETDIRIRPVALTEIVASGDNL